MTSIGVLHAGAMGSALAHEWHRAGHSVRVTNEGRSPNTAARAAATGAMLVDSVDRVVADSDIVVSVVPPAAAIHIAEEIAAASKRTGRSPLVVDANAISPATCDRVQLALGDLDMVDAGISGPPPGTNGDATVYLSGARAVELQSLATESISLRVVSERVGDASAAKMSSAAVLKGTTALIIQALVTARHYGVLNPVAAELDRLGGLGDLLRRIELAASKAPRFADEMREIASTQESASLDPALYHAIADVWNSVAAAGPDTPGSDLAGLIDHLMRGRTLSSTPHGSTP